MAVSAKNDFDRQERDRQALATWQQEQRAKDQERQNAVVRKLEGERQRLARERDEKLGRVAEQYRREKQRIQQSSRAAPSPYGLRPGYDPKPALERLQAQKQMRDEAIREAYRKPLNSLDERREDMLKQFARHNQAREKDFDAMRAEQQDNKSRSATQPRELARSDRAQDGRQSRFALAAQPRTHTQSGRER